MKQPAIPTTQCVVVADGVRARFLSLEHDEGAAHHRLTELSDLVNPDHKLASRVRVDASAGPRAHGGQAPRDSPVDHRERKDDEHERGFARDVIAECVRWAEKIGTHSVVVIAPPRTLGYLRGAGAGVLGTRFDVEERPIDLAKAPLAEIQSRLEQEAPRIGR